MKNQSKNKNRKQFFSIIPIFIDLRAIKFFALRSDRSPEPNTFLLLYDHTNVQMHIESLDLTQETSMMQINHDHFLRMKELANGPHGCGMIGVSAQTIWKWVKQKFPQPPI